MTQNDEISDVKMSEPTSSSSLSSFQSIPIPVPPFNPSNPTNTPYDPYEINKHIVKYDPVDSREFQQLFGKDKYMYFKKDKKHNQYQLALFLVSEDPKHYSWRGAYSLIETLMAGNSSGDASTLITNHFSCVHPKKKGGYAVSCTYRFVHDMDKPQEIIKIYYLIEKYLTKNDNLCNYVGCDRKNVRCHFLTNKQQVYNHRYLLYNIPLNIDSLGLFDKNNAIEVTNFINNNITTQRKVERYRWERIKSSHSGIITQSIELETLKPIIIQNKTINTLDINWTIDKKQSKRIIKIVNTGRKKQLETFKIYDPEEVETNFMKYQREFEEKQNNKQDEEQERSIRIINDQILAERAQEAEKKRADLATFEKTRESARAIGNALENIGTHNNNNHNHNRKVEDTSGMDIDETGSSLSQLEDSNNNNPSDITEDSDGVAH